MKTRFSLLLSVLAALTLTLGCTQSGDIKSALEKHPEWIIDVLKNNPEKFADAMQQIQQAAQKSAQTKAMAQEKEQMEAEFKNPKSAEIADYQPIYGNKNAPITVIEYSDFQCPYCQRGYNTVKEVQKKYGDQVRFIYKNLPLPFHPMAMPAAKRFVAISLQSAEKAYKYHDEVFAHQDQVGTGGEKFLDGVAAKVGVNMAKYKKDIESDEVKKRIAADTAEAQKFEFSGTPGFLVAGVSLKGAYPIDSFSTIIDRKLADLKNRGTAGDDTKKN